MVIVQGDSETDNYTYLMFYVFGNIGRVFYLPLLTVIHSSFNVCLIFYVLVIFLNVYKLDWLK